MGRRYSSRSAARQAACIVALLATATACKDDAAPEGASPSASASATPQTLSPELAARVVAEVGDRKITLGDYAAALRRMGHFEQIRYQSEDRRRKLLDEIVNVELLAREAERRGLDKTPEAQDLRRQVLRDELLASERAKLPSLDQIPMGEVRGYYDKHRAEFRDPERRRVGHIVMTNRAEAEKVLQKALHASPTEWGELVRKYSLDKSPAAGDKTESRPPLELLGDLGFVSRPGEKRGENADVPEPVRKAVFELEKIGQVYGELVSDGGRVHIVRLMGKSPARDRSFAEAERTIRLKLQSERIEQAEKALLDKLSKSIPVTINEAALKALKGPKAAKSAEPKP